MRVCARVARFCTYTTSGAVTSSIRIQSSKSAISMNSLRGIAARSSTLRKMSSNSGTDTVDLKQFHRCGRKILGAALNYRDILENPNVQKPDEPVLFLKPSTSYITEGDDIVIPERCSNVCHEVELGVVIGKKCKNVSVADAKHYVGGYCLGLDLSAFCELTPARAKGFPWSIGKGFDTSNPVSRFIEREEVDDCHNLNLWLRVNGELRQDSNTSELLYNSYELISYASQYMTLEPCDLIMTGTPKGAKKIDRGDVVEAGMGNGLVRIKFNVK